MPPKPKIEEIPLGVAELPETTSAPVEAVAEAPAVFLPPESLKLPDEVNAPRARYWTGTLPGAPWPNTGAGGISFNRFEDRPFKDANGETSRFGKSGEIHELTPRQVNAVLAGVLNRIVRWPSGTPGVGKAELAFRDDARYVPRIGDVPFAEYVYMVRLPENPPDGFRAKTPPSIAEESRRAAALGKKSSFEKPAPKYPEFVADRFKKKTP